MERTPYTGNGPFIFVSYARADAEIAGRFIEEFARQGYRLWWDDGIMESGAFAETVMERIGACSVFLCFVSPEYRNARLCRNEFMFALSREKHIIPIRLTEAGEFKDVIFAIDSRPQISFTTFEGTFRRAVSAVARFCPPEEDGTEYAGDWREDSLTRGLPRPVGSAAPDSAVSQDQACRRPEQRPAGSPVPAARLGQACRRSEQRPAGSPVPGPAARSGEDLPDPSSAARPGEDLPDLSSAACSREDAPVLRSIKRSAAPPPSAPPGSGSRPAQPPARSASGSAGSAARGSALRYASPAPPAMSGPKRRRPGRGLLSGIAAVAGAVERASDRLRRRNEDRERAKTGDTRANFSVLSPKAAAPDSYGRIDLYMYVKAERAAVDRAIREAGGTVNETAKEGFEVLENTSITARLVSDDAVIRDDTETQIWNGNRLHFDFQFYIPKEQARSQAAFTCYIEANGIPITRLSFIVAVTRIADPDAIPARVVRSDYRKAFISYSREDEQRMLARVLGIHEIAPDMSFWLDKKSMDAGVMWRKEIQKAINISDVLLLFWSVPASRSVEVEREWSYALSKRGLTFICPVPLDPPQECPPPDALKELNFSVRAFARNEAAKELTFYDSRNIILV